MGFGTVFPEMVMEFAETVTQAVEAGGEQDLSAEDIQQVAAAARETREKFRSMHELLRKELTLGVDTATFIQRHEPRLARLDKLSLRHAAVLAETDRLKAIPSETRDLIAEFEALGKAVSRFRDLLREALAKMMTPRRPVDWQRVQEAQEAFRKGETRPFERTPGSSND
jgi:hypothetical protein